jgi:signal transduction histidine kinase
MESSILRARETLILKRLQNVRRTSSQSSDLFGVLATTVEALEIAGGTLFLTDEQSSETRIAAEAGRPLGDALDLVQGLAEGTGHAKNPIIIDDLEEEEHSELRSLLIAPLQASGRSLGSLILWSTRPDAFTRRRAQLVAAVAGQAALYIENQRLYLHGEYQAALAERTRLAREIHDGLAQTLGYLKLRTAQIDRWLERGDQQQAKIALADTQKLLDAAYADTREAIDGLRLSADVHDLRAWAQEIASEFEALSGVPVSMTSTPDISLPPLTSIQLQRIVQESFSNIRKHADATRVWLQWQQDDDRLTLCIKDNGHGFNVDDFPLLEQHGLRIMHERAEALDAQLQVLSQKDRGTEIIISLPLKEMTAEMQHE